MTITSASALQNGGCRTRLSSWTPCPRRAWASSTRKCCASRARVFNWRRLRDLQPLAMQGLIQIEVGADRRERQVTLTPRGEKGLAQRHTYTLIKEHLEHGRSAQYTRMAPKHARLSLPKGPVQTDRSCRSRSLSVIGMTDENDRPSHASRGVCSQ